MSDRPAAAAVFDDLITALTEIRDGYVLDEQRWTDPTEIAEAFRYVGQVLAASSELFWEGDPTIHASSIVSPARKLQGDNPDAIYHFARIRGDRTYRVRPDPRAVLRLVHRPRAGCGRRDGWPLLGDRNDRDFTIADDGTYEIIFSATPHDGDWVELHPDAHSIVVRTYYELSTSAQNDASIHVDLDIRADDQAPPPRSTTRRSPPAWRKESPSFGKPRWGRRAVGRTVARAVRLQHPQRRRHTVQLP